MEILKFTLSGDTAFFKQPDVNTYLTFTYGNIHKVALMGIFGAIMGLNGYNQMNKEDTLPEFYKVLKNMKLSIAPKKESKGYISKKIHSFNNSVGYASKEAGGNLVVKQQWLEQPEWDIYIIIDNDSTKELKSKIVNNECVYIPYLGANNHPANILDVEVFDDIKINDEEEVEIDSLFFKKSFEIVELDFFDEKEVFKYEESLPIKLNESNMLYEKEKMCFTNNNVKNEGEKVYKVKEKNIVFY